MGLQFARHATHLLDDICDGADGDGKILGSDQHQGHDPDESDLGPLEIEHLILSRERPATYRPGQPWGLAPFSTCG